MIDLEEHITELFVATDVAMSDGGFHTDHIRTLSDPHAAADAFLAASPEDQERIRTAATVKAKAVFAKALSAPREAPKKRMRRGRPATREYRVLSPADEIEIVRMRGEGVPLSDIVSKFNVARSTIQLRIRAAGLSRSYTKKAAA